MQRNLWPLVAAYLPDALIADRTALENRPAADGSVFLIADYKRNIVNTGNKHSGSTTCGVPSLDRLLRTLGTALDCGGEMRQKAEGTVASLFSFEFDFEMPNGSFKIGA